MMKRAGAALVAILVALSLTGLAFAAVKHVTGELVSVNNAMNTLVVSAEGQQLALSVEGKPAETLGSLKPEDMVTVEYVEEGGKRTARAITKG
ncbi:MAG: hypothetical protein HY574_07165 [candidate division NC10 bacterium]|nr:hypothetical protein [candidate division NC10 bacterium]